MTVSTWTLRGEGCTNRRGDMGSPCQSVYMALCNNSDAEVVVRKVIVENQQATSGLGVSQSTYRLTSMSGGTAVTPTKADTASASLPSQVLIRKNPAYQVSDLLTKPGQLRGTQARTSTDRPLFGARLRPGWPASFLHFGNTGGAVEAIILREGEGVAWFQEYAGFSKHQWGHIIIRNLSSGATYYANAKDMPTAETQVMLGVFNGSGSGVVLQVILIEGHDVGQMGDGSSTYAEQITPYPGYRLALISNILDGETVSPVAHDSANALPSGITAAKNGVAETPGREIQGFWTTGQLEDATLQEYTTLDGMQKQGIVRGMMVNPTEQWGPDNTGFPLRGLGGARVVYDSGSAGGITLRRGECLALCHWYQSYNWKILSSARISGSDEILTLANLNVIMEFTVTAGQGTKIALAGPSAQTNVS